MASKRFPPPYTTVSSMIGLRRVRTHTAGRVSMLYSSTTSTGDLPSLGNLAHQKLVFWRGRSRSNGFRTGGSPPALCFHGHLSLPVSAVDHGAGVLDRGHEVAGVVEERRSLQP